MINSKKRFRAISKGAIKTEKFANLLTGLKTAAQTRPDGGEETKNETSDVGTSKPKLNFSAAALSLKKTDNSQTKV